MFPKLSRKKKNRPSKTSPDRRRRLVMENLERREMLSAVAWSAGPSLPSARTDAAAVLAPDDALLVIGGNTNVVAKLADGSSTWTTAPAIDKALKGPGAVATSTGQLLVYGGMNGNNSFDEGWTLDYPGGDHQDIDQLSTPRADFSATIDEFDHAYAIGGIETDENLVLSSADRYDPIADAWQGIASLPAPRHGAATAADDGGFVYVIGGSATLAPGGAVNTVFRYSVSANTWDTVAPLPIAVQDSAAVYAGDGSIYVMGGLTTTGVTAAVQAYSTLTNTWTVDGDMPEALYSQAAGIDSLGRIVVAGGTNASGAAVSSVYRSQRLDIPESPPVFTTAPVTTGSLESPYSYNVNAAANPEATYALIVAPDGMTINPVTGVIAWQPIIGQHGQQSVTVRAENRAGLADQSFVIDVPVATPAFTSDPVTSGSLDAVYSYDANAYGIPAPTYSLVAAPAGMMINAATGLISWQPVEGQQGQQSVTVRAANFVGATDQSFTIDVALDTIAPSAPTLLTIDSIGATSVDLSWQPAADNRGVEYYEILQGYRSGWRGRNTSYRVIMTGIVGTSATLTGLAPLSSHKLVVRAVDGGGNVSLRSNQVIALTQSPPILRYYSTGLINGAVGVTANHLLELTLAATANPAPTYSLVSGPSTMTVDPVSGLLQWTPTAADVGAHTLLVQATNPLGSSQVEIPVTVAADLPVPGFIYNPNSGGSRLVIAGLPLELQAYDASHTPSTFALIDGPAGMTLDPVTGLMQWSPVASDAGQTSVTIRATNSAGSTDRTLAFETFFTAEPTNLQVTGATLLHPTVTWTAPAGEGAGDVAGYTVTAYTRYRNGRAYRSHSVTVDVPGGATSTEIAGLLTGKDYKITVNAYNATGDRGALSTQAVNVKPIPAIPTVSWTVTNPGGGAIVANQPVEIQLNNLSPDPATFALLSGPAGMSINPVTGLATWTPSVTDIGPHSIFLRAINSVGPRDITVSVNVLFSGAVTNVSAVRNGNSATVTWFAPTDNTLPVASYQVTMHWNWSSRRRSRTITVAGDQTSITFALVPTGAVWHRGVTITAVDEFGRLGASTPLTYYT